MKQTLFTVLLILLFTNSCTKETNDLDQFDSSLKMSFNNSIVEYSTQTFSNGLSINTNSQQLPDDILLGFTSIISDFNILLRERYIINDLKNPTDKIDRLSIEGGESSIYKPSQEEFEKIFRLGSKHIITSGNFMGRESGLIMYYQNDKGYYVSSEDNFSSLDSAYFRIDEFKKIQSKDVKDQIEIKDLKYTDLYCVKASFSLKLIDKTIQDTIILKNAKTLFYVYN